PFFSHLFFLCPHPPPTQIYTLSLHDALPISSRTSLRPRRTKSRRNSVQKGPSSVSPTSKPRTSRSPELVTPTATTRAMLSTRPLSRTLMYLASNHTYG